MDALDRELAAALAVDPSPEFIARVRARIADEPAPSSWRMPRMMLAASALTVVVVAVVLVGRVDRTEVVVDRAPGSPDVEQAFRPAVSAPPIVEPDAIRLTTGAVRHRRPAAQSGVIQIVSIDGVPAAPMGEVVPQMAYSVVTMTGVHP